MNDNTERSDAGGRSNRRFVSDHDEIRTWADRNDMVPVRRRDDDRPDLVHRDEMRDEHTEQEWDSFLDDVRERDMVLAYTETDQNEVDDYRLAGRTEVVDAYDDMPESVEKDLLEGETVTTEVTEREVLETEVVERATIESELVDSQLIDSEIVGTEIVDEEIVGVAMVERTDAEVIEPGDRRYFDDDETVVVEEGGTVALEIDETRIETEEQIQRHTIESRVVQDDIEEDTSLEDESFDVDTADIHQHLEQSDLLPEHDDVIVEQRHIETEFDEDDVATSTLTTHSTVENVIEERKTVLADVTDVDIDDSHVVSEETIETGVIEEDTGSVADSAFETGRTSTAAAAADREEVARADDEYDHETVGDYDDEVEISDRVIGRSVELQDGTEVGIVSEVDDDGRAIYVDEDPSLTDKIKASLHMGGEDDAFRLGVEHVVEVTRDAIVVDSRRD